MGGFLTVDEKGEPDVYRAFDWEDEESAADYLFGLHGDFWQHNGGIFDNKWALDRANERGLSCVAIPAGGRIIELRIGKNLRLLDSKALTKISLEDLTKGADVSKEKLGLDCVCGESCGGYCSIRRGMAPEAKKRCHTYLRADCYSLLLALQKIRDFASKADIDLGITVGSAAWTCARRWLRLPKADLTRSDHEFARAGYFGGRVLSRKPYSRRGYEADVSSMYPSRLAQKPVPVGEPVRHIDSRNAGLSWLAGLPGIFKCRVEVPESNLPPLPYRGPDRVYYPYGTLNGVWARPELEYAIEQGAEILEFDEALVWPDSRVLFTSWVEALFKIRVEAPGGKSGPLGIFVKYLINSITGKFGAKPDNETVDINPAEIRSCHCDLEKVLFGEPCECGAHAPYGDSATIFLSRRWRLSSCAHVEWAAYLTAEARVEWLRQALSIGNGGDDVVYGDTDSLFTEVERKRNAGKALGEWEQKGAYREMVVIAPKVYWFERDGLPGPVVRGKGLRLGLARDSESDESKRFKAERARRMLEPAANGGVSEAFSKDGIVGFWRGASDGRFFVKDTTTRRVSRGFGDRILDPGRAVARAPHISEVKSFPWQKAEEEELEGVA